MAPLKNHPDWPEYWKKAEALRDEWIAAEEKLMEQYPVFDKDRQKAHAAACQYEAACHPIKRRFNAQLRQLQQEYSHLFPKDE